ncbi:MAG: helix-turn-helix domain-containing protein [Paludibacteraceae bacterium]|nr:helix-turn-helix domain-containing protein [Paludibacteraceae bacterium]
MNKKLLGYFMLKKHPYKERLQAVKLCLAGYSVTSVGHRLGINKDYVLEWLLRYQRDGKAGLRRRIPKRATYAEKCKIVCKYAEKHVSLQQICVEHNVSRSAVERWTRIYRKGGYEALRAIKPRGTGCKGMGRPKKQEPQTELERLRYENEYLRAEVALLKKVRALMEEKEKRLHEIGRKPSKH